MLLEDPDMTRLDEVVNVYRPYFYSMGDGSFFQDTFSFSCQTTLGFVREYKWMMIQYGFDVRANINGG